MNGPVGIGPVHEPESVTHPSGNRVRQPADGHGPTQGLAHEGVNVPTVEAGGLGLRVDSDDPARPVADQIDDRAHHLQGTLVVVGLAEHHGLHPLQQLAFPPGLVEEGQPETTRLVRRAYFDEGPALPGPPCDDPVDTNQHHALGPRLELSHGRLTAAVQVPTWIEAEQIEDRSDPDVRQGLRLHLTYTVQVGDRPAGQFPEGDALVQGSWVGHGRPGYSTPR